MHPQSRNNGAIAQLVEQRTENPCVPGSIPGGTTCKSNRDVAQLVAHYVRDVGVGRSSRLIPTNRQKKQFSADFCFFLTSFHKRPTIYKQNGRKLYFSPLFLQLTSDIGILHGNILYILNSIAILGHGNPSSNTGSFRKTRSSNVNCIRPERIHDTVFKAFVLQIDA